jgi:hypothetical protein
MDFEIITSKKRATCYEFDFCAIPLRDLHLLTSCDKIWEQGRFARF